MTREQTIKFLNAYNRAVPFLPPVLSDSISDSDVMRTILSIANGMVACELKPAIPTDNPPAAAAASDKVG